MPASQPKMVVIPEPKRMMVPLLLQGTMPLLLNRPSEKVVQEIKEKQGGSPKREREARNPEAEAEEKIHWTPDGKPGIKSTGLKNALVSAGRNCDWAMTTLRQIVQIEADVLEIVSDPWYLRTDLARPNRQTFTLSHRPQFDNWKIVVPVVYLANKITLADVINLFDHAGFSVGIGSYRPECSGPFGRFMVVKNQEFQEVEYSANGQQAVITTGSMVGVDGG